MDYLGFCALQKQFAVEYEFCNYKLKNYICAAASKACDLTSESDRSEFLNTLARFSAALCGASSEFNKLPEESRFRIDRLHVGVPARKILDLLWDVSRAADAIKFDELRFESWQAVMIENGLPCRYGDWVSILDQVEEIDFASTNSDKIPLIIPGDGLYCDEKTMVWGGKKYEKLTKKMVAILTVFVEQYKKGFPKVPLGLIKQKSGYPIEGSFLDQAFKQHRRDEPRVHPVAKVIESAGAGFYRLIDPTINKI